MSQGNKAKDGLEKDIQDYEDQIKALENKIDLERNKDQRWFWSSWLSPRDDSLTKYRRKELTELRTEVERLRALLAGVGGGNSTLSKYRTVLYNIV